MRKAFACLDARPRWRPARYAEIRRLDARWGRLETQLVEEVRAGGLDVSAALAEGSPQMQALDARIRVLGEENETLLGRLPTVSSATVTGVAAKLRVVLAELWVQDHPDIHRLVRSALDDLARIER